MSRAFGSQLGFADCSLVPHCCGPTDNSKPKQSSRTAQAKRKGGGGIGKGRVWSESVHVSCSVILLSDVLSNHLTPDFTLFTLQDPTRPQTTLQPARPSAQASSPLSLDFPLPSVHPLSNRHGSVHHCFTSHPQAQDNNNFAVVLTTFPTLRAQHATGDERISISHRPIRIISTTGQENVLLLLSARAGRNVSRLASTSA